jgi:hypothetical protein
MKLLSLLFCFGAGQLQNAMERSSLQMKPWIYVLFQGAPMAATIAELIPAFRAFRWWGILICYGLFGCPDLIRPVMKNRNPFPFFAIGFLAVAVSSVLMLRR